MGGVSRRAFALGLLAVAGCRPGLGVQMVPKDYVHTFTRRDLQAVYSMSTESFRAAVWIRVSPEEFRSIARLMGHGQHMEVLGTRFEGDRAVIQTGTDDGRQFRLNMLCVASTWLVDDVLVQIEPWVYVSKRRQAEAVLAVRDFRLALTVQDPVALDAACSAGFSGEVWRRMTAQHWQRLGGKLADTARAIAADVGEVRVASEGSPSVEVGGHVVYFVKERGRLVVDDVALPKGPPTMRVRLRNELAGG